MHEKHGVLVFQSTTCNILFREPGVVSMISNAVGDLLPPVK